MRAHLAIGAFISVLCASRENDRALRQLVRAVHYQRGRAELIARLRSSPAHLASNGGLNSLSCKARKAGLTYLVHHLPGLTRATYASGDRLQQRASPATAQECGCRQLGAYNQHLGGVFPSTLAPCCLALHTRMGGVGRASSTGVSSRSSGASCCAAAARRDTSAKGSFTTACAPGTGFSGIRICNSIPNRVAAKQSNFHPRAHICGT